MKIFFANLANSKWFKRIYNMVFVALSLYILMSIFFLLGIEFAKINTWIGTLLLIIAAIMFFITSFSTNTKSPLSINWGAAYSGIIFAVLSLALTFFYLKNVSQSSPLAHVGSILGIILCVYITIVLFTQKYIDFGDNFKIKKFKY